MTFKKTTLPYWIAAAVLFFPCLIMGYAYFDDDLLLQYGINQIFLKKCLLQGHLPLWNPYIYAGQPFLADPNAMVTYPLLYLDFILPRTNGFGFFYFLHFGIAAIGMHFWLKSLDLSDESCWVGAFCFSFSGFFWCEIIHPPILAAFAWLPWFFSSLERLAHEPKPSSAFFSGITFAMLFLAGCFQVTLGALYAGIPYFLLRNLPSWGRKKAKGFPWTGRISFFLFFILGSMPLGVLWVPFSQFMTFSDRPNVHLGYVAFNADISLDFPKLVQLAFPINPFDPFHTQALPYEKYLPNAGYLGIWAFFLISLAFFRKKGKQPLFFLASVALLGVGIALGKNFFLHRWLCEWAPGFHLLRAPIRFLFIYVTCASALIALGFETLMTQNSAPRKNPLTTILSAFAYALAFLWIGPLNITRFLFLITGLGGLFFWLKSKKWQNIGKWVFLISILLPLFQNGYRLCPSRLGPASNFQFEKGASLMSKVREKFGGGRIFLGDNIPYEVEAGGRAYTLEFPTNATCLFGLKNVGGYGALSMLKRGQLHTVPFPTFLRLMAIQGFVTGNDSGNVAGFDRTDWGPVKLYENLEHPPLVYTPVEVEVIEEDGKLLEAIREGSFDPYEKTYLSKSPSGGLSNRLKGPKARLEYRLVQDDLDEQEFEVDMDRAGWAVFSEVNYPGWKAWVDGAPAEIITSNYLFRGLYVPAGRHKIEFRFQPAWWTPLLFLSALWLLAALFFWFWNSKPR